MPFIYTDLLKSIQQQKCALILGPNACLTNDGKTTFSSKIASTIQAAGRKIKHYPQDDLYYISPRSDRTWASNLIHSEISGAMQDLANPTFYTGLYQQLTELPFHLVLSLSPDKFLFSWMKFRGLDPQFISLLVNVPVEPFECPTVQRPLIFNLFGETGKAESMILTQEDVYKYLTDVFSNTKKLENLKTCLRDIDYLLFLGCPLDRWYVKLLMPLLDVNSDTRFIAYATNPRRDNLLQHAPLQSGDPEILEFEDFCQKHFNLVFAEDNFLKLITSLHEEAVSQAARPNPIITLRAQPNKLPVQAITGGVERTVAISYAASDSHSVSAAEIITQIFTDKGYKVLTEKISLSYKSNILNFIKKLATGKAVITIISNNYLRDKNCMQTALIMKEDPEWANRIFPVVLADAEIYDAATRLRYMNYWENKKAEINDGLHGLKDQSNITSVQEELNLFSNIRQFADGFVSIINNMNTLGPDIHAGQNFQSLFLAVEEYLNHDA